MLFGRALAAHIRRQCLRRDRRRRLNVQNLVFQSLHGGNHSAESARVPHWQEFPSLRFLPAFFEWPPALLRRADLQERIANSAPTIPWLSRACLREPAIQRDAGRPQRESRAAAKLRGKRQPPLPLVRVLHTQFPDSRKFPCHWCFGHEPQQAAAVLPQSDLGWPRGGPQLSTIQSCWGISPEPFHRFEWRPASCRSTLRLFLIEASRPQLSCSLLVFCKGSAAQL